MSPRARRKPIYAAFGLSSSRQCFQAMAMGINAEFALELENIGTPEWASARLNPYFAVYTDSFCSACGTGPSDVWRATRRHAWREYCLTCWGN